MGYNGLCRNDSQLEGVMMFTLLIGIVGGAVGATIFIKKNS
jgi:hypothetical protein